MFLKKRILLEAGDDSVDDPKPTDYTDLSDDGGDDQSDDTAGTEPEANQDDNPTNEEDDVKEEEPTDYSVDSEETTADDTGTESDETTNEEPETENETNPSDVESNRILMQDYVNLYDFCQTIISRLNGISKSNLLVNQVITQISANINLIEQQIYEYIIFSFMKRKYPLNLYKYNQFVLAVRINVEMLKKINIFTPDSQNN